MPTENTKADRIFSILVAEDNRANQILVRHVLQSAGYSIEIAENGEEAVRLFKNKPYDLVLMDIQMPVMDGIEATKIIRSLKPEHAVPIIAFTALPPEPYRKELLSIGMNDYLNKPCASEVLIKTLSKHLRPAPLILVVDDMQESSTLITKLIFEIGSYRTHIAVNGVEAIKAVRDHDVALILMDMEMPVMDGYTAARSIRSLGIRPEIPIIAMTAHEGDAAVRKCLRAGCTTYIHKPVRKKDLQAVIGEFIGKPVQKTKKSSGLEYVEINPDLKDLLPGYLENRKKDTEKISGLLQENNLAEIRRISHSMCGSGGGYGFPKISRFGKALEKAALAGDINAIRQQNAKLLQYLQTIRLVEKKEPEGPSQG